MDNKFRIFIFFEEKNQPSAQKLEDMLQSDDIEVCLADDTTADEMTNEDFALFAKDAYAFVFLLDSQSLQREFLEEEIGFALRNEKIIIPVMLEDINLTGAVAHQLSNVQYVCAFGDNTENVLTSVANQLRKNVEYEKTATYSIAEFFAKKFIFEIGELRKKATALLRRFKAKLAAKLLGGRILSAVGAVVLVVTMIYLYIGLSAPVGYSRWEQSEIYLMTFVPIVPGALVTLIMRLIFGKIKNPILLTLLSVLTAAMVFCAMMLTGFSISIYLQR